MKKVSALILLLVCVTLSLPGQSNSGGLKIPEDRIRTGEEGLAGQEFRRGVQAYYRGSFNEAIVQFEKSLSYLPEDNLILEWLGKAYYKAGLEGSALNYWETASENGYGGLLLKNRIEVVRERRVTSGLEKQKVSLSEAGSFDGNFNGNMVFSGPVSVLPNPDGTFYATVYNTNEIILLNQNGTVIDRITGPLNGFDRPLDIIRLKDGNILVSEAFGNRLSLLSPKGKFIRCFGSKGRGVGQMVGPQYITQDDAGNVYVSDYGNRRIDVFDSEGNGLFFFGGKEGDFTGLKGPTGIAVFSDSIFVCDDQTGAICQFDRSGNFERYLSEPKTFSKPEAMRVFNKRLVVCDSNRILGVHPETGSTQEYGKSGNAPSRLICAAEDVNSNVIVTDFKSNEIYMLSEIQELVGGMFVQIENVNADAFPNVIVEVKVENRHRQPLVGLEENNFYLTENKRPVSNQKLLGSASNNSFCDITFIIDRSIQSSYFREQIDSAVREISKAMNNRGTVRIVSAGRVPVTEFTGRPFDCENFSSTGLKTPVSSQVSLDLALRLAANDLVSAEKKRAVVLLTAGHVTSGAFENYNLAELASYMNNNNISFSLVQMSSQGLCRELSYLMESTSGEEYYIFRPEGISSLVSDLIDIPQGVYQLSFTSSMTTNYGEKYLPLETEVYLLNRSGRDETGYFAPLQ